MAAEQVRTVRTRLAEASLPTINADTGDASAGLIDLIAELEALKNTATAIQADAAVEVDKTRRGEEAERGVPAARRGRGVASEIALARRESPHRGRQLLSLAKTLRSDLPCTAARLRDGSISQWRASLVARESACLDQAERAQVDHDLCADPKNLEGLGTRALVAQVKKAVAEKDAAAVVARARRAESERHVSIRPAPDAMCYLTALLPVAQGVGVYAALTRDAEQTINFDGEVRGKGQVMADLFTARLTGAEMTLVTTENVAQQQRPHRSSESSGHGEAGRSQEPGEPGEMVIDVAPPAVPVTVNVTISDLALLGGGQEAATITGNGVPAQVVPAEIARQLLADTLNTATVDNQVKAWIRRLYTDPGGNLIAMSTKSRLFPAGLGTFLTLRDQGTCRTPYCDAPIRHIDHIVPSADDGDTDAENGQGACEACNHSKQAPGWTQTVESADPTAMSRNRTAEDNDRRHRVTTTTPTGRRYRSTAPRAPRSNPRAGTGDECTPARGGPDHHRRAVDAA
ncbi:HNH endonuclease signature motif containing protein [Georgenia halophila]|uniref:HNH endonuclease signature motif containing protein n=1 Tax=Georgenia halophila TaxID=620889 RepID=A0ABP8LI95_9MICO